MLITHVSARGANTTTSGTVNTAGASLIVVVIGSYNAAAAPTLSDNKSNAWTGLTAHGGADSRINGYFVANPLAGAGHSFTFTTGGPDVFGGMCVAAFDRTLLTSPLDQQAGTDVAANPAGSITPTLNGELVIALQVGGSADPTAISDGFDIAELSIVQGGVSYGSALAYKIQGLRESANPTWTNTGYQTGINVSFKSTVRRTLMRAGGRFR